MELLHPQYRILPFLHWEFSCHSLQLSRALWIVVQSFIVLITLPNQVSLAKLLTVYCVCSSRSLVKILSSIGTITNPKGTLLVRGHQLDVKLLILTVRAQLSILFSTQQAVPSNPYFLRLSQPGISSFYFLTVVIFSIYILALFLNDKFCSCT